MVEKCATPLTIQATGAAGAHYAEAVKIYTRDGDDGSTGLYFGGRVAKSSDQIEVNGAVDEAQATLGLARSLSEPGGRINALLIALERDLWVLMAEVATLPANRHKLIGDKSLVTEAMITRLEEQIDALSFEIEMPKEFVVPGENQLSASLDVARTVVRRAERVAVGYSLEQSLVVAYLNRLSDLVWTMARWAEGPHHRTAREY
jgi:cob(I)alamin adenosyltransferase